jgi:2-polyprenyl-6-methoxyphenol hydroxylase-like FAD-dependent oxidoreductase
MSDDHLSTARVPLHVLIIGGGIAGLCLAQGLKQAGISVAVYECDSSARFKGQGYRLGIKQDGSRALRECLPEHLFDLAVATSIRSATRMVVLDHQLHQQFSKPLPHGEREDSQFGVDRFTLRQILLAGLEDIVRFGKTCEGFDQLTDGKVRARFADGTSASGDLLVGADGTGSVVRGLLVPDARIDDLHAAIYGKTPILPGTMAWLPEVLAGTFNRMHGPDGVAMAVATCIKWESLAAATARLAPALRLVDTPDYLSWTLGPLGDELRSADGATLHRLAQRMLKRWHPAVRRIVEEADVGATFAVPIRSARPVQPWRAANVTLLGDAIHTMSPGRGEGANVALRDAALLRRRLVDVTNGMPLVQAKAAYETEMLGYGFQAVADSLSKPFARRDVPGQGAARPS